ncbi:AMP-binding protein [Rhodohalobacter sp.]|uniref:AMP-binding protein n=1 Tax=Rhodohalobacter sp. TaxID=1974210 RepID=UPI002ACDCDED|nr:AMP-binding protein [Rhodohalobacter sp.]
MRKSRLHFSCPGEELYVLDEQMNETEPGTMGDLYISGVGVGLGYWEDPEKTDEVFLENPLYSENGDLIYKTGDLAREGKDGLIYFHGRSDTQIKSRGYRIELGEIENAINSITDIMETAVVAIPTDDFDGKAVCCAYVLKSNTNSEKTEIIKKSWCRIIWSRAVGSSMTLCRKTKTVN